jgi:hypothetical protein
MWGNVMSRSSFMLDAIRIPATRIMSSPTDLFSGAELVPHIESAASTSGLESASDRAGPDQIVPPPHAPSPLEVIIPLPIRSNDSHAPSSIPLNGYSASSSSSSSETSPTRPPPALRRTPSNVSSGSTGSTPRDKRRLRFTPMNQEQHELYDRGGSADKHIQAQLRTAEEGGQWDQDPLRSDPGTPKTPNILETWVNN